MNEPSLPRIFYLIKLIREELNVKGNALLAHLGLVRILDEHVPSEILDELLRLPTPPVNACLLLVATIDRLLEWQFRGDQQKRKEAALPACQALYLSNEVLFHYIIYAFDQPPENNGEPLPELLHRCGLQPAEGATLDEIVTRVISYLKTGQKN